MYYYCYSCYILYSCRLTKQKIGVLEKFRNGCTFVKMVKSCSPQPIRMMILTGQVHHVFYTNLHEVLSFISTQRQSPLHVSNAFNVDPNLLQGKQLLVYSTVKQHFESNDTSPLYMTVSGTAGTSKSYIINSFYNQSCESQHLQAWQLTISRDTLYILFLTYLPKGSLKICTVNNCILCSSHSQK